LLYYFSTLTPCLDWKRESADGFMEAAFAVSRSSRDFSLLFYFFTKIAVL